MFDDITPTMGTIQTQIPNERSDKYDYMRNATEGGRGEQLVCIEGLLARPDTINLANIQQHRCRRLPLDGGVY